MTENSDSLTHEEEAAIRLLHDYEGSEVNRRRMRVGMLEDKAEEKGIEQPRRVVRALWGKRVIALFDQSGKLWEGRQWFFEINTEGAVEVAAYRQFRCKLTEKGRELYTKLPEQQPATPDTQQRDRYTISGKTIEFRTGEILCDGSDIGVRKDDGRIVLRKLCEKPDQFVPFTELLPERQHSEKEAEQPLRDAVTHLSTTTLRRLKKT